MTDDVSLALARAVERLAELQSLIHLKSADLSIGEYAVGRGDMASSVVERSRQKLADLRAEKERAVLDLAAQLTAWRGVLARGGDRPVNFRPLLLPVPTPYRIDIRCDSLALTIVV